VAFICTGYKGLPQWSVLSPFMYNFYTRLVEACLHPPSSMFISGKHVEAVRDCLQMSLTRLMTWFGDLGLSLSANKSEMMVFFPGNMNIPRFWLSLTVLRNVTELKYLGIIFDRKLTWRLHAEYI
jgi:hypothetical protein